MIHRKKVDTSEVKDLQALKTKEVLQALEKNGKKKAAKPFDPTTFGLPQLEERELIRKVSEIFYKEIHHGASKLQATIPETAQSTYGQETFRDGYVVYLPPTGKLILIGDTHGDFLSTLRIIQKTNFITAMQNQENLKLVFMGDYIDRGKQPEENLRFIFGLKQAYPDNVFLLRGNHEDQNVNKFYTFKNDYKDKPELYDAWNNLFEQLPGIIVVGNGVIIMHGGVPKNEMNNLKAFNEHENIRWQSRWNDPTCGVDGIMFNERGGGTIKFGQYYFDLFMKKIGAKVMFRSHQAVPKGYDICFNHKLVTIFSSGGKKNPYTNYTQIKEPRYAEIDISKPLENIDDSLIKTI